MASGDVAADGESRRVKFHDGKALVAEFDDSNLWAHGISGIASLWRS